MNMFKTVAFLSKLGYRNRVYVDDRQDNFRDDKEVEKEIAQSFIDIEAEIHRGWHHIEDCDILVPTSWNTVYIAKQNEGKCKNLFYFVHGFEPYFYPLSSDYIKAENTYRMGFSCITSSRWLAGYLRTQYGADVDFYDVVSTIDKSLYHVKGTEKNGSGRATVWPERPRLKNPLHMPSRYSILCKATQKSRTPPLATFRSTQRNSFKIPRSILSARSEMRSMITGSPNAKQYTNVFNDITNNCNLRCVFCPSPFSGSKNDIFMNEELFQKVMTLLPLVPDGNFLLSCAFEPTIHPYFTELLKSIPMQHRRKVCFTTNLARRNLSDVLIEELSQSSLHHINISLDSFDPGVYESLRRGARFSDFINNLERLTRVFSRSCSAPPIRYITLVCRSNIDEVSSIMEKCAKQYLSAENEFRYFWITDRCDRQWVKHNTVTYEEWKDMANKLSKLPYKYSLATAPGLSPPDPSSSSSKYDRFISEIQDPQKRAVHTIPPAPNALWIQSTGRVDVFGYDVHFDLNNISEPYDFFKNLLEILWLSTERANELRLYVAEWLKLRGGNRNLSEMESRIHGLKVERERLVDELSDIRSSFGYKLMRFYAPKIDRICPEGTMRGQLIRIIRRIISGEHNLPPSD